MMYTSWKKAEVGIGILILKCKIAVMGVYKKFLEGLSVLLFGKTW